MKCHFSAFWVGQLPKLYCFSLIIVVPRRVTSLNKSKFEESGTGPVRRNGLNSTCYKLAKQLERKIKNKRMNIQRKIKNKRMNISGYLQVLCSDTKTNSFDFWCFFKIFINSFLGRIGQQILLAKVNHYGTLGVSNGWFKSYLSNRNQYVPINGYKFGLATLSCGIPQGSVLGPLLFLLYINDLNQAIKFCKVHHFVDDTNLLCLSNSIKKLKKTSQCWLKVSS